jgi:adenylylsulfate kinase
MNCVDNIIRHHATVTRERREKLNGHKACVLWFTGLSGAGKSTLAHAVEEALYLRGCRTFVLDGDNVRHGLTAGLGFSMEERRENIRRVGEAAKLMMEAGLITLAAFISPFRADRAAVRSLMPHGDFLELYCKASLETCESRDVKGFYKRARAGAIKNYTGIDSPYEEPVRPDIVIDTGSDSLQNCVAQVLDMLMSRGILPGMTVWRSTSIIILTVSSSLSYMLLQVSNSI